MVYSFALIRHANIRYRDAFVRMSTYELISLLKAVEIEAVPEHEFIGGADFLTFECRPLSESEISFIGRLSSGYIIAERQGNLLLPLDRSSEGYLPDDLPEVLKYKGKTSVPFTEMMMNMGLSVTPFALIREPVTLLDPLCGKGTSCFCAARRGWNAVGLDTDAKSVREAADYFSRYLKFHHLKHVKQTRSETVGRHSVPVTAFTYAACNEQYRQNDTRSLEFGCGDTAFVPALTRRRPAHLIVADLPYGVQHSPQFGEKPETFQRLLARALPEWRKALRPGGSLSLSFNTLTISRERVLSLVKDAGFALCEEECFSGLRHEVEQAVVRDVVYAVN